MLKTVHLKKILAVLMNQHSMDSVTGEKLIIPSGIAIGPV